MIGYYVHHHGRGHLARANSICAHLREPVTVLSSLEVHAGPHHDTVTLPRDDEASFVADPTANGTLHWVPLHDSGLRERMRLITDWVATARPTVMVVDVSVEVAMLVRLLGVPVIVVAMPGNRTDAPHDLVFRAADHIVAAWPRDLYEPQWLRPHAAKTTYVGGISRFDGRAHTPRPVDRRPQVLVLSGAGGSSVDMSDVSRCASAHPQFRWTALGVAGGPWAQDPWPDLCSADVVVSSAGQSSVADIATAARPAVVIPAVRPFDEQHAMSRALDRGGLALVRDDWPDVHDWPSLIDRARANGPDGWSRWETQGAAARAAVTIEQVAAAHRVEAAQ